MKNFKRILSTVLALALCFSAVGVFAADSTQTAKTSFSDVEAGTKLAEAVNELVVYGIIAGYPDGTFKPDGQITRGEFAAVVTRFKGLGSSLGTDAVTGFADLDSDTENAWARPYVKAAVDAGIINGFEDGTFRAGEPVTYEQAVKMVICAIGYNVIADSEYKKLQLTNPDTVTWSSGYIAAANKNNITLNATVADILQPASRAIVAMLSFNALDAPKINVITDANGKVTYEKDTGTNRDDLSSQATKIEGTISANCYTALDAVSSGLNDREIRITNNDGTYTYTLSDELYKSVDVEELLGRRLNIYVDGDTITKIVYKSDTETVIEESQIDTISGDTVKYRDKDGRTNSVSLSGYTFIYNGKYASVPYSALTTAGGPYEFRNGYIKLLESGGERIAKITSFDVWVVNGFDKKNEKITFKYGKTVNGEQQYTFPAATSEKPAIYLNGKLTSFDSLSLSQYAVINYAESVGAGKTLKKMYVTTGAKSGKVTSKSSDTRELELDGKTVYLTRDYDDYAGGTGNDEKPSFELGDSFSSSLYYDYTGQIAAIKYSAASLGSFKYGYLVGAGESKNKGTWQVRIVTTTGSDQIFTLKDRVKLDGTAVKAESAVNSLGTIAESKFGMSAGQYYQPLRYSVSGTTIDAIDTVETGTGATNDSFKETESGTLATTISSTSSLKKGSTAFNVSSSTVILSAPGASDDKTDMSKYAKLTSSQAFSGRSSVDARVFDVNESTKNAGLIIVYGIKPAYLGSSPYMIVTRKYVKDNKICLEGYANGAKTTSEIIVSDNYKSDTSSVEVPTNSSSSNYLSDLVLSNADEVEKGDIVAYLTDGAKEVTSLMRIYDASNPVQAGALAADGATPVKARNHALQRYTSLYTSNVGEKYFHYGVPSVISDSDKRITLSFYTDSDNFADDAAKQETLGDVSKALLYNCSSAVIYELDNGNVDIIENFETMSASDVTTELPTKMIIVSGSTSTPSAKVIYIIRN